MQPKWQHNTNNSHYGDSTNDYRKCMDARNNADEEDELEELESIRQREWNEQEEYEHRLLSL